jgi:hypothetical protein
MSNKEILFSTKQYPLQKILQELDDGELGLPDLQRPFKWKSVKVRDLFDSMYKGFPVGTLLLWKNSEDTKTRKIGTNKKQNKTDTTILDGQQRLTSLYSVMKKKEVINEKFSPQRILIGFNPLEEKFEVPDSSIKRNPDWIADISSIWETSSLVDTINQFVENLEKSKSIEKNEKQQIQNNITRLHNLINYDFTLFELNAKVDGESAANIFERLNNKGTKLNQPDFILTIMSVFWPLGREDIRDFSRSCIIPPKKGVRPFNEILEPLPPQLIRVISGLAFRRARLKFVFSILNGKNLETGEISGEEREKQFKIFMKAQKLALDVENWNEFMKILISAGIKSKKMITSDTNILFCYVMFLIGKIDFKLTHDELRKIIAKWFFMNSLRGRYTGSQESTMERDFAKLRNIKTSAEFIDLLDKIIGDELTEDFWNITLPNNLDTSSSRSPSLFAYQASLVLLDAKVLFSDLHHLFPKNYLKTIGLGSTTETNNIANYAHVEWTDNLDISDDPPEEYMKTYSKKLTKEMSYWHALPKNWQNMKYHKFLVERRKLISNVIRDGFEILQKK